MCGRGAENGPMRDFGRLGGGLIGVLPRRAIRKLANVVVVFCDDDWLGICDVSVSIVARGRPVCSFSTCALL